MVLLTEQDVDFVLVFVFDWGAGREFLQTSTQSCWAQISLYPEIRSWILAHQNLLFFYNNVHNSWVTLNQFQRPASGDMALDRWSFMLWCITIFWGYEMPPTLRAWLRKMQMMQNVLTNNTDTHHDCRVFGVHAYFLSFLCTCYSSQE